MAKEKPSGDKADKPPKGEKVERAPKGDKQPKGEKTAKPEKGEKAAKGEKKGKDAAPQEPAGPLPTPRMQEKYFQQVLPTLIEKFGRKNVLSRPRKRRSIWKPLPKPSV